MCQPRDYVHAEAFGVGSPGAASSEPPMARFWRLGRGLGAGQRHGMDRQGTCEIPLTSTSEVRRNRDPPVTMGPGSMSVLHAHRERLGDHEHGRRMWGL